MKKKALLCKIICYILLALAAGSLVLVFTSQAPYPATRIAVHLCILLAAVCAFIYVLAGARKADAKWFFSFEALLALAVFLSTFRSIQVGHSIWGTALNVLSFGALCIFTVAKDLGQKKSVGICVFFILCQALAVILQSAAHFSLTRAMSTGTFVLMAVLLLVMLELKYMDKSARKTGDQS